MNRRQKFLHQVKYGNRLWLGNWRGRWRWRLDYEPRDMWIGVYWKRHDQSSPLCFSFYVCLVPCFPIKVRRVRSWAYDNLRKRFKNEH